MKNEFFEKIKRNKLKIIINRLSKLLKNIPILEDKKGTNIYVDYVINYIKINRFQLNSNELILLAHNPSYQKLKHWQKNINKKKFKIKK